MLVDSGVFAGLIYVGLLAGTILWLGFSARQTKLLYPGHEGIPLALQTSLLVFSVAAYFYSSQREEMQYILLMCAACWHGVRRDLHTEPSPEDVHFIDSSETESHLPVRSAGLI
jgi:hypothetical protein